MDISGSSGFYRTFLLSDEQQEELDYNEDVDFEVAPSEVRREVRLASPREEGEAYSEEEEEGGGQHLQPSPSLAVAVAPAEREEGEASSEEDCRSDQRPATASARELARRLQAQEAAYRQRLAQRQALRQTTTESQSAGTTKRCRLAVDSDSDITPCPTGLLSQCAARSVSSAVKKLVSDEVRFTKCLPSSNQLTALTRQSKPAYQREEEGQCVGEKEARCKEAEPSAARLDDLFGCSLSEVSGPSRHSKKRHGAEKRSGSSPLDHLIASPQAGRETSRHHRQRQDQAKRRHSPPAPPPPPPPTPPLQPVGGSKRRQRESSRSSRHRHSSRPQEKKETAELMTSSKYTDRKTKPEGQPVPAQVSVTTVDLTQLQQQLRFQEWSHTLAPISNHTSPQTAAVEASGLQQNHSATFLDFDCPNDRPADDRDESPLQPQPCVGVADDQLIALSEAARLRLVPGTALECRRYASYQSSAEEDCEPASADSDSQLTASEEADEPPQLAARNPPSTTKPFYYPSIQGCRSVDEFECLNRIEEGTYGVVYRARDKKTTEIVALKRLKMEKERDGFPITSLREINTLMKAQHENVVTVREIVVGNNMDKIYLVMDYVEHDLKSLMEIMNGPFSVGEVKCLLIQLLRAVSHLHDNWILHRDLKTSNLLLSHKGILKVGDFGLAREYGSPLKHYTEVVVTLWYRAPELLLGSKSYTCPIDLWSVGCIFAEFLLQRPLFPGKGEVDQLNIIFRDLGTPNERIWPGVTSLPGMKRCVFTEYAYNQLRRRFTEKQISDHGFDLLNSFLTYCPDRRIVAEKGLSHAYFNERPRAIHPSMFPSWPAKSEGGVRRTHSPRPPPGGGGGGGGLGEPLRNPTQPPPPMGGQRYYARSPNRPNTTQATGSGEMAQEQAFLLHF